MEQLFSYAARACVFEKITQHRISENVYWAITITLITKIHSLTQKCIHRTGRPTTC